MQIDGKLLLASAQNILKNRNQNEARSGKNETSTVNSKKISGNLAKADMANSRMLKLQADLKSLQQDYTREQVREDFLSNKPEQINRNILYANSPLFPEHGADMDMKATKEIVSHNIKRLVQSLKGIQVEIENLYALHFEKIATERVNLSSLESSFHIKEVDPKRVARLTSP